MRKLILAAALLCGASQAHAGAYDVTECYGGDYRWVISLDKETNKAAVVEFVKGELGRGLISA